VLSWERTTVHSPEKSVVYGVLGDETGGGHGREHGRAQQGFFHFGCDRIAPDV